MSERVIFTNRVPMAASGKRNSWKHKSLRWQKDEKKDRYSIWQQLDFMLSTGCLYWDFFQHLTETYQFAVCCCLISVICLCSLLHVPFCTGTHMYVCRGKRINSFCSSKHVHIYLLFWSESGSVIVLELMKRKCLLVARIANPAFLFACLFV